jgi:uncharacterized membrane protein
MPRRIIALLFDTGHDANEALQVAMRLHERKEIAVHDAVMVTRRENGELAIDEPCDSTAIAATVPAAMVGGLFGAVVAGPLGFLIGAVLAGGAGVLIAKFFEGGISDRLVHELAKGARPGQAVLALELGTSHDEKAVARPMLP